MAIITAQIKKIGDRIGKSVSIQLPEESVQLFKQYKIELIDYGNFCYGKIGVFLIDNKGNDILSQLVNPRLSNSFQDAFKKIHDEIRELKKENDQKTIEGFQNSFPEMEKQLGLGVKINENFVPTSSC